MQTSTTGKKGFRAPEASCSDGEGRRFHLQGLFLCNCVIGNFHPDDVCHRLARYCTGMYSELLASKGRHVIMDMPRVWMH